MEKPLVLVEQIPLAPSDQMMFSIQLMKSSNIEKYESLKKILENSVPFIRCQTIQRR